MSARMADALTQLRDSGDYDTFVDTTREDFTRMAADIYRAWKLPAGVEPEDVRQEMLLALVERRLVETWDPSRQSLDRFVIWQAYTQAKRFCHRQRASLRRSGSSPSRHPLSFTELRSEAHSQRASELGLNGTIEPEQEDAVAARELAVGIRLLLGDEQARHAFDVLQTTGGDAELAAERIWGKSRVALLCRVGSLAEARKLVDRVLADLKLIASELLAAA